MENNEWIWYFREERERNGISRKAVAAVAGISRNTCAVWKPESCR